MISVRSAVVVKAPASHAYRAFTNGTAIRAWMCDYATVNPQPRGRMYLWWRGDFYSSGHYLSLDENMQVKFRWYANIDPAPTEVLVTFDEHDGETSVVMVHEVPDEPDWESKAGEFKANWDSSLQNLKSVLETGIDQRIASQPMIGVLPGDFTLEQAEKLQVPVTEGFRLDGVLDGMGAALAGLKKDDVIVAIDSKPITNDFATFRNAIAGKTGGDTVEVTFYRGPQKKIISMELTRRPMVEVPFDAAELASQGRVKLEAALTALEDCFQDVSDEQANARPAPNEWNALEILAHILHTERFNQTFIVESADGFVRQADGFGGNLQAQVSATVQVYPTVEAMIGAVRRGVEETLALVENLPVSFVQDKSGFYQVGNAVLLNDFHIHSHIPQIKAALEAA